MTDTIATAATVASKPPPQTGRLAQDLAGLLWEAKDLPQPTSASVFGFTTHIDMQFTPDPSSYAAIAQWAARFGGTTTNRPVEHEGNPSVICETRFTTYDVQVSAFALIRTS